MKRRVVVTGIGAVSPIGIGSSNMWENAKDGKLGIDFITQFDTEESKVKIAGEVKDFDPCEIMDKMEARRTARFTQFALYAAEEAFKQSSLDMSKEDALRCGVYVASGIGGLPVIQRECLRGDKHGYDRVSPLFVPSSITNMAAGMIAIKLGFKGSCTCVVTACASASDSIGAAFHYIRDGYSDVMACGGAESCICELGIVGFASMTQTIQRVHQFLLIRSEADLSWVREAEYLSLRSMSMRLREAQRFLAKLLDMELAAMQTI